jgi:flagellar hook-basal body complex protein FliE
LLENIDGILSDQLKLNELIDSTKNIQHILDTYTVQKAIDDKINMSALKDELESLNKRIETLHNEIAVKRAVVSAGTTADIAAAKTAQELVNANIAFKQMAHTLETFLAETIEPLKAIERYNKRLILENIDGQRIVKAGLTYINSTLEKLPEKASKLLQPVFNKLAEAYKEALKTGNKPGLTSLDYSKELLDILNTLGTEYKANNQVIEEVIKRIDKTIAGLDGKYPEIESILQKIEESAAKQAKKAEQAPLGQSADLRDVVEAYQDALEEIGETVRSIDEFIKKDATIRNALQKAAIKVQKQTYELLLADSKRTGDRLLNLKIYLYLQKPIKTH